MRRAFLVALLIAAACSVMIAAPSENAKYIGIDKCKMCHSDVHSGWQKVGHARAFDLLTNVEQDKNPECLPCHTTGYGKGGFTDAEATPGLKAVTCEACHGPGSEHNGDATKIVRDLPATVCAGCHLKLNIHNIGE
ncbi:MAG: cytochrome c family protein [Armatimonadetes bacterium]|nr:cytochrome c family protein [Armatimonadota bacterium]